MPKIDPETKFSDIIIPTMDLVRGSFLVHLLTTNKKKVINGRYCNHIIISNNRSVPQIYLKKSYVLCIFKPK